ncbi:MAG: hypothetical protein LBD01_03450 [Puniceicoccales bacterium]|jgi:hypothetical protein|nr:hypothetical protein [Puniceicoccales bacterium]
MKLRVSGLFLFYAAFSWAAGAAAFASVAPAAPASSPKARMSKRIFRVTDANGVAEYAVPAKSKAERWAEVKAAFPGAPEEGQAGQSSASLPKPDAKGQPQSSGKESGVPAAEKGFFSEDSKDPTPAQGAKPAPQKTHLSITSSDGRALPFNVPLSVWPKKRQKMLDESVDPHSTLRSMGTIEGRFAGQQYGASNWEGAFRAVQRSENNTAFDELLDWQSRFSAWGVKKGASFDTSMTRETSTRDVPMHEREMGQLEQRSAAWSREMAVLSGDKTVEQKRHFSFLSQLYSLHSYMTQLTGESLNADQRKRPVSMMSINRYQFRRSHPTTPGLPAVSPGGAFSSDRVRGGGSN